MYAEDSRMCLMFRVLTMLIVSNTSPASIEHAIGLGFFFCETLKQGIRDLRQLDIIVEECLDNVHHHQLASDVDDKPRAVFMARQRLHETALELVVHDRYLNRLLEDIHWAMLRGKAMPDWLAGEVLKVWKYRFECFRVHQLTLHMVREILDGFEQPDDSFWSLTVRHSPIITL